MIHVFYQKIKRDSADQSFSKYYLLFALCFFFHSGDRIHTSRISAGNVNWKNSEILCQEGHASKQLQHTLPELSPVRQQLPATNLEEVGRHELKAGR